MKRFILIALILTLSVISLFAQETQSTSTQVWTLRDCMLYALDNSPEAKIQEATNDSRRVDNREAYLQWVPQINGYSSVSSNFGRSIDPETNVYTTTASLSNGYTINAYYTIFNGFSVVNNYKVSKVARLSGIQEYQQIKDNICLKTIQAYFNAVYEIGMVEIRRDQLEESRENLKRTRIMEELGLKGHADLLQVEAEVASNDYNYVREQNMLEKAMIDLKSIMFFPTDEVLTLDTEIRWLVDPYIGKENTDSIFDAASAYLPSLQIAEYKVRQAKLRYNTAAWSLLPSFSAQAGVNTGYIQGLGTGTAATPFSQQIKNNLGESISLSMSIPIFDALTKFNNKARRRNDMKIAQYQRDQKMQEVETEIQKAVQDMEGAAKEYIQADKRTNAQILSHKANQQKYEEGLISVLDLQNSSNQLLSSKAEKLKTVFTYLLTRKVVYYYKGVSYIDQE